MKFRAILLTALLSLTLAACYSLAEDITPPPDYVPPAEAPALAEIFPAAAPDVANGAAIYVEKCAPCHGPTGLGDGLQAEVLPVEVPALGSPEIANRTAPVAWYTMVTQGNLDNFMPGFASLTDQERWNVVAYAHSLSLDDAQIEAGKAIYDANCALCHGPDGKLAANADFSNLQWLVSRSLDELAISVRQGKGMMPGFEGQIADADVYASLAYVRTFAYTAPQAVSNSEQATPIPASASETESTSETETPAEGAEADPAAPVETDEAETASNGQVSGLVFSAEGGELPSDLKVVLHGFDHDMLNGEFAEVVTLEAGLAKDGSYLFENVEMPEGRAFYVSLDYAGTEYSSDAAFVQDGLNSFDLPIQIYETSTDPSALVISQAHILLDFANPDVVSVIYFLVVDNPTNKTIVSPGEGQPSVSFSLPEGFGNLQFEDGVLGGRFMLTEGGFGDQVNILPGAESYQLVFAYDLPYTAPSGFAALFGGATELSLPLTLPARAVTILVPDGMTATADGLVDSGPQSMGNGISFQMYRAGSFPAGATLEFTVSGSPKAAATVDPDSQGNNQNLILGVGALGAVLIAVGGYLFWRDRRRNAEESSDDDEDELAEDAADELDEVNEDEILDAIVALDDLYKSGNIAEPVYRERRAELKAKLRDS